MEEVLLQLIHFASATLPSALKDSFFCEFAIKEAISQAKYCEQAVASIPLLEQQLEAWRAKFPEKFSGLSPAVSLFSNAVEQLYSNFIQNSLLPRDTLTQIDDAMEELVGQERLQQVRQKALIYFCELDELSSFLLSCPPSCVTQVEAHLVCAYISDLPSPRDIEKKINSLLKSGYKGQMMVLYMLGSPSVSIKPTILKTVKEEVSGDLVHFTLPNILFFQSDFRSLTAALRYTLDLSPSLLSILLFSINSLASQASFVESKSHSYSWTLPCGQSFESIQNLLTRLTKDETLSIYYLPDRIQTTLASLEISNSLFWDDLLRR